MAVHWFLPVASIARPPFVVLFSFVPLSLHLCAMLGTSGGCWVVIQENCEQVCIGSLFMLRSSCFLMDSSLNNALVLILYANRTVEAQVCPFLVIYLHLVSVEYPRILLFIGCTGIIARDCDSASHGAKHPASLAMLHRFGFLSGKTFPVKLFKDQELHS